MFPNSSSYLSYFSVYFSFPILFLIIFNSGKLAHFKAPGMYVYIICTQLTGLLTCGKLHVCICSSRIRGIEVPTLTSKLKVLPLPCISALICLMITMQSLQQFLNKAFK
ncbi:unnamed protein product [Caretta caretta]